MEGRSSPSVDTRRFLAGNVADLAMRNWLDQDDPQPGTMSDFADAAFDRMTSGVVGDPDSELRPIKWMGDPRKDKDKIRKFVRDIAVDLEPLLLEHVVPKEYMTGVWFEVPLNIPYLDGKLTTVYLRGELDILTRDDNMDCEVLDLKASVDPNYIKKTLGQGFFYKLAVRLLLKDKEQPKRVGFIFPAIEEKLRYIDISQDDMRVMLQRIIRMAHGSWRGEFDPKVSDDGCKQCEVYHACDKWKLVINEKDGKRTVDFAAAAARRRTYPSE